MRSIVAAALSMMLLDGCSHDTLPQGESSGEQNGVQSQPVQSENSSTEEASKSMESSVAEEVQTGTDAPGFIWGRRASEL